VNRGSILYDRFTQERAPLPPPPPQPEENPHARDERREETRAASVDDANHSHPEPSLPEPSLLQSETPLSSHQMKMEEPSQPVPFPYAAPKVEDASSSRDSQPVPFPYAAPKVEDASSSRDTVPATESAAPASPAPVVQSITSNGVSQGNMDVDGQ
jgi:hypothetical protein